MKLIHADKLVWLDRKTSRHRRQALRQAGRLRRLASRKRQLPVTKWRTSVIRLPEVLLAEKPSQRDKLAIAISSAKSALERPRRRIKFDFSRTSRMYPGGTLLLMAYMEMLLQMYPHRIKAKCPPNSLAGQLLHHFGIADQLGVNKEKSVPKHASVVNWQYRTGTGSEGSKISGVLNAYRQLASADIPDGLYDVLNEALTNVKHHAYPQGQGVPEQLQRWWLFAKYVEPADDIPGNLYIAVYDIGVGIQRSMRQKLTTTENLFGMADAALSKININKAGERLACSLLKQAVEHPRSSTGLLNRGKGLPEMREFVLGTESGKFFIISGEAQYSCLASDKSSEAYPCKNDFLGTLILWSIPLQRKESTP